MKDYLRIMILSDTHELHDRISILEEDEIDLLIHAGDFTTDFARTGRSYAVKDFLEWFAAQPATHKIFIAGNHDWGFFDTSLRAYAEKMVETVGQGKITYLCHQETIVEGIKVCGTPWQPVFHDYAFNAPKEELRERYAEIPEDTQILITHCPPLGILDRVSDKPREYAGSSSLKKRVSQLPKLRLHAFGHIHPRFGIKRVGQCQFVNASQVNHKYAISNAPIILDINFNEVYDDTI